MKDDKFYFEQAIEEAKKAFARGDDAFGSVLVDENGEILMGCGCEAVTGKNPCLHDTISLVFKAVKEYPREVLEKCTIYAVLEPCVMCTAATFWAGISKIKFAMAESEFEELLPGGLSISSREFAERSPRKFESIGPFEEITEARKVVGDWVATLK